MKPFSATMDHGYPCEAISPPNRTSSTAEIRTRRHIRAIVAALRRIIDVVIIGKFTSELPNLSQNSWPRFSVSPRPKPIERLVFGLAGVAESASVRQISRVHSPSHAGERVGRRRCMAHNSFVKQRQLVNRAALTEEQL